MGAKTQMEALKILREKYGFTVLNRSARAEHFYTLVNDDGLCVWLEEDIWTIGFVLPYGIFKYSKLGVAHLTRGTDVASIAINRTLELYKHTQAANID